AASLFPPLDPAWLKAVAAMKPDEQVKAVEAELKKRNPDLVGSALSVGPNKFGAVQRLIVQASKLADITPIHAFPVLVDLTLQSNGMKGKPDPRLTDLSPRRGLKLTGLNCFSIPTADLEPLGGIKLASQKTEGPFTGPPLELTDLSPL